MTDRAATTGDPLDRLLSAAEPIRLVRPLPSPEALLARLVAAAEAGDEKAAHFVLTFVPWARKIC
jgi:hypothetical protein